MKRSRYEAPTPVDLSKIIYSEWKKEALAHNYGYDEVMDVALHVYDSRRLTSRPWLVTFGEDYSKEKPDHTTRAEIPLGQRPSVRVAQQIADDLLNDLREQLTQW